MTLKKFAPIAIALACALGLATTAAASGGGGGGMSGGMSGGSSNSSMGSSNRTDPAQAYQLGVAALQAQNYREAVRQFRAAHRVLPNDGTINYALGLAYAGNGDKDEAKTAYQHAISAENAPVGARLQLGLISLELGDRATAEAQQQALQTELTACAAPACSDQRHAQLQASLDQLTQALAAPAPAANPVTGWNFPSVEEGRLAYADAVGLINRERYAEAFDALQRASAAVGPQADVLNYMGFTSRHLGHFDAALAYYQEALRIEPNHLGANEYLGELYLQLGDVEHARTQLARLDRLCAYGCAQREELAHWIQVASN